MGYLVIDAIGSATTTACTEAVLWPGKERLAFATPLAVIAANVGVRPALVDLCLAPDLAFA
jgi:hypothetical protein